MTADGRTVVGELMLMLVWFRFLKTQIQEIGNGFYG